MVFANRLVCSGYEIFYGDLRAVLSFSQYSLSAASSHFSARHHLVVSWGSWRSPLGSSRPDCRAVCLRNCTTARTTLYLASIVPLAHLPVFRYYDMYFIVLYPHISVLQRSKLWAKVRASTNFCMSSHDIKNRCSSQGDMEQALIVLLRNSYLNCLDSSIYLPVVLRDDRSLCQSAQSM